MDGVDEQSEREVLAKSVVSVLGVGIMPGLIRW